MVAIMMVIMIIGVALSFVVAVAAVNYVDMMNSLENISVVLSDSDFETLK